MLSRRTVLLSVGSLPILSRSSSAKLQCQDFPNLRRCTTGLNINLNTARQRLPHWCWAACIEAIFDFYGYNVSQERIVEKVFGDDVDEAAMGPQIVEAVDGSWESGDDTFTASATVLWDTQFNFGRPDAIVQAAGELENDRPLIIGAFGHATMLTAMTYSGNGVAVQLEQLVVRDPWPGNPNRRALSLQEAMGTQFLAKIEVE